MTPEHLPDVLAWLRDTIEDDLAVARAVRQPPDWHQGDFDNWELDLVYMWPPERPGEHWRGLLVDDERLAAHIARHDPRNVIADCEAKLAVLQAWESGVRALDGQSVPPGSELAPDTAIALMCAAYRHRPGWKTEWSRA